MSKAISQHKQLAMGATKPGYKKGGAVAPMKAAAPVKSGFKDGPMEKAKRANGIVGLKKGGMAC